VSEQPDTVISRAGGDGSWYEYRRRADGSRYRTFMAWHHDEDGKMVLVEEGPVTELDPEDPVLGT
jgi:hypothetical protein